jgi:hypothetical protein
MFCAVLKPRLPRRIDWCFGVAVVVRALYWYLQMNKRLSESTAKKLQLLCLRHRDGVLSPNLSLLPHPADQGTESKQVKVKVIFEKGLALYVRE